MAGYDFSQYQYANGGPPAYPPQPYTQQHYEQQHYDPSSYGYSQSHGARSYDTAYPSTSYQQYGAGYPPSKKQRSDPISSRYPPATTYGSAPPPVPPVPGYTYSPGHVYLPPPPFHAPQGVPPPPPPGWIPPPPPGWRAPPPQHPFHPHQSGSYPAVSQTHRAYPQQSPTPVESPKPMFPSSIQWRKPKDPITPATPVTPAPVTPQTLAQSASPTISKASPGNISGQRSRQPSGTPQSARATSADAHHDGDMRTYEWDFESEDYWYKDGEPLNDDLSLGSIMWQPAQSVRRVIPCFHHLTGEDAISASASPNKEDLEPVSKFVLPEWFDKQCGPIRENEWEWPYMQDDPIFKPIPSESNTIPIDEVVANRNRRASNYRETRMDAKQDILEFEEGERASSSPARTDVSDDFAAEARSGDMPSTLQACERLSTAMDIDDEDEDDEPYSPPPAEMPLPEPDARTDQVQRTQNEVLESLSSPPKPRIYQDPAVEPGAQLNGKASPDTSNSKVSGVESKFETAAKYVSQLDKYARPDSLPAKPGSFTKDQAQEDVLARLGVTGLPKPVFAISGPAYAPAPRRTSSDVSHEVMLRAVSAQEKPPGLGSISQVPPAPPPPVPPPPPMPEEPDEENPWGVDGHRDSPKSETSQHTLAGSDFHDENDDKSTEGKSKDHSPYEEKKPSKHIRDSSEEPDDGRRRQKDDVTPRLRRRQPKVASAYSRRW